MKTRRRDASRFTANWVDEIQLDWVPIEGGMQRLANPESKRVTLYAKQVDATLIQVAIGAGVSPISIEKLAAQLMPLVSKTTSRSRRGRSGA